MIKNTDLQRWFICNERVLIGLSYVASAGQITGCASGTREGGDEASSPFLSSPFLSSCVLDICSFAPTKKLWLLRWGGTTLEPLFARQSTEKPSGRGGDKRFVHVTLVLLMSSKMRKSRHLRKFQTMINSLMRKLHYSPLILRRTNVRLDSCSLTIAYTLLPGDHCSLLSLSQRMSVRWHATELTVKWRSTDRLLSPMCTYCVLGYLLLEPHRSPHTHRDTPTQPPNHRTLHFGTPYCRRT